MKTKKAKQPKSEPMNFVQPTPWEVAKTKHAAYMWGREKTELELRRQISAEFEEKKRAFGTEELRLRQKALSDICQAGSSIIEGMTKAYLAFEKCL